MAERRSVDEEVAAVHAVTITPADTDDLLGSMREAVAEAVAAGERVSIYVAPGRYESSGPLAEMGALPDGADVHVDCAEIVVAE